ncbi:MAG: hypothetical protein QOI06_2929 [Nocardioidaceae bacterium]|nr:hypothetical protein [Nocardioidaceae bacterium]
MTGQNLSGPGDLPDIDLYRIFAGQEEVLARDLQASKLAGHPGVHGDGNEGLWLDLLRKRLPNRYTVSKAIVVDSAGGRSHQIDAVIHDRQYSPQVWERGEHNYVPAESVYAVFEIKPEINRDYVLYASSKIASVRRLSRTSSSFTWASGTHEGREDFVPLGGLLAGSCGWTSGLGAYFEDALADVEEDGRLDLGCVLGQGAFEIVDRGTPNEFTTSSADRALVSFLLTLLGRLQGLGTAPAIDYSAYASWIDGGPRNT